MPSRPDPLPNEESTVSTNVLAVKTFLNSRTSVLHLQGHYHYEDLKTEGPVLCDWEIRQEAAGLTVRGQVQGTVELECARCLETFQVPIAVALDERYVLNRFVDTTERERELQAEDFFEVVEEDGELDLKDLAHQFLVMETGEHTACGRPDCHLS